MPTPIIERTEAGTSALPADSVTEVNIRPEAAEG